VTFTSAGVSWLAVRDASGRNLFEGQFKGERRFPLGQGLRVMAGRPDLVTVRMDQVPPRKLGRIDQLQWVTIKAPAKAPSTATAPPPIAIAQDKAGPAKAPAKPDGKSERSSARPQQVTFTSTGVSWLAVRDASGRNLFEGEFKGERRFPLGKGLRVIAGRPDLVTVRVDQVPPRKLGRIDQLQWQTIQPPKD
jgi:hypothetical protein